MFSTSVRRMQVRSAIWSTVSPAPSLASDRTEPTDTGPTPSRAKTDLTPVTGHPQHTKDLRSFDAPRQAGSDRQARVHSRHQRNCPGYACSHVVTTPLRHGSPG